jgi:hypothetical protein
MRRALPLTLLLLLACTNVREPSTASATDAGSVSLSHVPVPAPQPTSTPAPSSSGTVPPPDTPTVKLATIGMHVGGGPYDEPTKEPMKHSVEPRFPDLARCWKHVTRPALTDVGVDLVIEAAGGRARVSNPRTSVGARGDGREGFVPCVVAFFESVDFQRPKNGKTVVSYSVRFTP